MTNYISKRKYGPRDLAALGLAITATLTGTNKPGVLRQINKAWAWTHPKLRAMGTIGIILALSPWAAIAGIFYMIEQVLKQRHPTPVPMDLPPDLSLDLRTPQTPPMEAVGEEIPQTPIGWDRIDAAYDLPAPVPSAGPSVAPDSHSDVPAAQKPPRKRKRKEKATERTEEGIPPAARSPQPSPDQTGEVTKYRKKGNVYVPAKKRVKNETLFTKGTDGEYYPISDTVADLVIVQ